MPDKDNFGAVLQPIKWPADVAPTLNQSRTGSGSPGYSNQELFSQGGGGLIPVAIQGNLIGRDKGGPQGVGASTDGAMYTMTKADVHGVAQAILFDLQNNQRDTQTTTITMVNMQGSKSNACVAADGTSFTLNAMHGHDVHAVAVPLDLRNSQRDPEKHDAQNRQGLGVGNFGDPAPTVDASFVHGVAHAFYSTGGTHGLNQQPEVCPPVKVGSSLGIPSPPAVVQCVAPTITAGNNPSRSPQSAEVTQQVAAVHAASMTVRRLTPRECERLQGFPDDYTLIPWRKRIADDCPDGPRYKALGNSMAVNCMEWIGERIAAVEADKETP
jgi:site-specific DNA-cytosine methylase